ncbi:MAG: hypothetical protein OEM97_01745, partial [Acidimicrobiia bacterium]|nr:hypothetical protein [Acidimicrobiia bacterium]
MDQAQHQPHQRLLAPIIRSIEGGAFTHAFAVVGVVITALQLLAADGRLRAGIALLVYMTATIAVGAAIAVHRPRPRTPWIAMLVAIGLFTGNIGAWMLVLTDVSASASVWVMDLFKLGGIIALAVSIAAFVHVRRSAGRRDTLLDGTLIAAGGAMMLWQWYVLIQGRRGLGVQPNEMIPIILVGLMLTVGLVLYRLVGGTKLLTTSARYSVSAAIAALIGQGALVLTDSGAGPARWTDFTWISAAILLAAGALHPSMRSLTAPIKFRQGLAPRLVIAGAALLANPVLVLIRVLDGTSAASTVIIAGVAMGIVALVGLWRVGRLVVQLDTARTALARSERRFRSLVQRASEV